MKQLIILITTLFFISQHSAIAQSANAQAIAHYREAVSAYESKNYSKTFTSLEAAVKLLKKSNARIEALRIKTYIDMGNISEARRSLNVFSGFTADYSLYEEINPYIARIEQAELKELDAKQQVMQQEFEKQEKQQQMSALIAQLSAQIEADQLDEATNLLAKAKQLSSGSNEERELLSSIDGYITNLKEEKSLYKGAQSGDLSAIKEYLKRFADHPNASTVAQLFREKETSAYNMAVSSDKFKDYLDFMNNFPNSKNTSEIYQRLKIAEEREGYQFFVANRTTANAFAYLNKFPDGANRTQVMAAYEELLYADALEYERSANFLKAKETFLSYQYVFPDGKNSAQVNRKLGGIDKKISRQSTLNKIDSRTYGVFSYGTNGTFGGELGRLPGKGFGGYLSVHANGTGLTTRKTSGMITQQEIDASDEYKIGILGGSLGVNYLVAYPLWVYGGIGLNNQPYHSKEQDRSFKVEGRKTLVIFPEVGIKSRLGGIILKAGYQIIREGGAFQVGIGF